MAKQSNQICPECKKEVTSKEYFMVALERPYMNLFFHKDCFKKAEGKVGWEGLSGYISQLLAK